MNKLKIIGIVASLSVAGCSTTNISKVIEAMAKDNASVHVSIRSIYANVDIDRVNANTNTPAHTIKADGTITVRQ